jgi:excisionase family DNA binding protein
MLQRSEKGGEQTLDGDGTSSELAPVREWGTLPEWITTEEAAGLSGYDVQHVRRLARRGRIGAVKKGHDWWVNRDMFKAYLEAMSVLGSKRHDPRAPWRQEDQGRTEGRES